MKTIDAGQLHEMMLKRPGMPVVNVLPIDAHREAHIPGTPNVPVKDQDFMDKFRRLVADKGSPVVVYCKSRECDASATAATKLEEAGYQNVYDFAGGIDEWKSAGYSLVHG